MATDGEIDFSSYTREQLDSAVTRIDRARYPINAQKLIAEYQRRRAAEGQVAEQAAMSGIVLPPDHMLSAPKTFAVMFEPRASFINWLGPSRNDFHLVGSGSIGVDDALVRVKGRRFAYWVGIPVVDAHELGRQFVVNVEVYGRAVRFELRVPGERIRGLAMWLRSAADAEELSKLLPSERTPDFTAQLQQHVEFEQALITQSPKTPVTYTIFGICVFVYVGTALGTNQLFEMSGPSLVPLGSNFGPYTTDGDWWRLVTAMFLHGGLIHLAFNMWALLSFGRVVERLYGSISYALIYFIAGVAGSFASVSWNPAANSIGASGAIFGLLGALIAAQVRNDGSIPASVLRPLRNSSLIFTGCALLAGLLSSEVDNAAHLGGVAAGFLLGVLLSRPIMCVQIRRRAFLARMGLAGLAGTLIVGVGFSGAQLASKRLTGDGLFVATMHWFGTGERGAMRRWHTLSTLAKNGELDHATYANRLEAEVIPFWKEADARATNLELPTSSGSYDSLQFLRSASHDRLHAYELLVTGLRQEHGDTLVDDALQEMNLIQARINQRVATRH